MEGIWLYCYVAPRLPHCAAPCMCVCVQGAQHRGSAAYQARASPVRPQALQCILKCLSYYKLILACVVTHTKQKTIYQPEVGTSSFCQLL